jgi:Flp pilus assembly protein TadG
MHQLKRRSSDLRNGRGASLVEFALASVIITIFVLAIIDVARIFHARTSVDNTLTIAMRSAQEDSSFIIEFDQVDENSIAFRQFDDARNAIADEVTEKINPLAQVGTVNFFNAYDIDELSTGARVNTAKKVAFVLPGKASFFVDPTDHNSKQIVENNKNICRSNGYIEATANAVMQAPTNDLCTGTTRRNGETFAQLTSRYPVELVIRGVFNGLILQEVPFVRRIAFFIPPRTNAEDVVPTITPATTPTATAEVTITEDPSPFPVTTVSNTPTLTATATNIATNTLTATLQILAIQIPQLLAIQTPRRLAIQILRRQAILILQFLQAQRLLVPLPHLPHATHLQFYVTKHVVLVVFVILQALPAAKQLIFVVVLV